MEPEAREARYERGALKTSHNQTTRRLDPATFFTGLPEEALTRVGSYNFLYAMSGGRNRTESG